MENKLNNIKESVLPAIEKAGNLADLDAVRVSVVGKNGTLTALMKELGTLSAEEKKQAGVLLNAVKTEIMVTIVAKKEALETAELNKRLENESVDVTLPCRPIHQGRIHPITQATEEALAIFAQMGFEMAEGPDIEDDWHNFEALNTPKEHPARQMQATFFLPNKNLLRTQTSGVQIRTMETKQPPIRIVCPGRTYRRDYDATHTPMFHQIEGLVIDEKTNLANLKSVLVEFFKLFGISESINWTSNEMVMYSIMLVMVWQFSGYVAVIFLAAIKNVPTNIINAAKLDGAYMPRVYWKMILPQMTGAMGSCITILAMYALRSFDLIYSLTSYTNPASATLPIMSFENPVLPSVPMTMRSKSFDDSTMNFTGDPSPIMISQGMPLASHSSLT